MATDKALVDEYLKSLPEDRRVAIVALRKAIVKSLPKGYEESIGYGMLSYQVPLSVYADTYNKKPLMYAGLGSQKNNMVLHLCTAYGFPELRKNLETGFRAAGKKLDMGKGCLRFKKLDDLDLGVIASLIAATPMSAYVAFTKATHSPEAREKRRRAGGASKAPKATKATKHKPRAAKKAPRK